MSQLEPSVHVSTAVPVVAVVATQVLASRQTKLQPAGACAHLSAHEQPLQV
jgi:hypothetical protein